ncbi:MAG: diguanylate cyclase [Planctomycetota bacterium]
MSQLQSPNPTRDVPAHASEGDYRPRTHLLDDAPLRSKVALMVVTGVMVGIGVDLLSQRLDGAVVFGRELPGTVIALVTFLVASSALILVGQWWIAAPFDRLVRQIDRVAERRSSDDLSALPLTRRDEPGRIARAMHRVTSIAIRHNYEARQLRRTLDDRVRQATERATVQLRRMALRDPLTDLGNRRFLDLQLEKVIHAARESQTDVAVLAIDMDGFKQVNDALGHDCGDELLVLLAGLLKACTRHDDLAVRLGGDEFVVIMPGCDHERAAHLADSLRNMFQQQTRAAHDDGPVVGLSAGVASIEKDQQDTGRALLKLADQRLYEAKRRGKAQTCSS